MDNQEVIEQKIEITPEMIQAGYDVMAEWNEEYDPIHSLVSQVFRAMWASREHNS